VMIQFGHNDKTDSDGPSSESEKMAPTHKRRRKPDPGISPARCRATQSVTNPPSRSGTKRCCFKELPLHDLHSPLEAWYNTLGSEAACLASTRTLAPHTPTSPALTSWRACCQRPSKSEHRLAKYLNSKSHQWVEDTQNPPSRTKPAPGRLASRGARNNSNSLAIVWTTLFGHAAPRHSSKFALRRQQGRGQCPFDKTALSWALCPLRHGRQSSQGRHISQRLAVRHHGRHALLPGLAARAVPPLANHSFPKDRDHGG